MRTGCRNATDMFQSLGFFAKAPASIFSIWFAISTLQESRVNPGMSWT
jgi:hypothetical protein